MIFFIFFNIGGFYLGNNSDIDGLDGISFGNELDGISFGNEPTLGNAFPDIYHIVLDEYTSDDVEDPLSSDSETTSTDTDESC